MNSTVNDWIKRLGGGVNGSQLEFLEGTWPMFQIGPNVPLY
jgi:hypothetical protein